jgi:hypothetical protein
VGKKLVVTVHWMDGKTETFDDVEPIHVADGVLTIRERKKWWDSGPPDSWRLPLANIRSYSPEWVKRPKA